MAPSVENKEFFDIKYPVINISDTRTFSPFLFDFLVKRLTFSELFRVSQLRFVVANDRLVSFPRLLRPDDVHVLVDQLGRRLQCAGSLDIFFDPIGRTLRREIYGHSKVLRNIIPLEQSNQYKQEVIVPRLGVHFDIR